MRAFGFIHFTPTNVSGSPSGPVEREAVAHLADAGLGVLHEELELAVAHRRLADGAPVERAGHLGAVLGVAHVGGDVLHQHRGLEVAASPGAFACW